MFVPAKEIGDSIWAMIVLYVERSLGKPSLDDEDYAHKIKEYRKLEIERRSDSFVQTVRRCLRPSLIASASIVTFLIVLVIVVFAITTLIDQRFDLQYIANFILGIVAATFILFVTLAMAFLTLSTLLFKLYYNEYHTLE